MLMNFLWTAVVLAIGMIFGIILVGVIYPKGTLTIDETKEKDVFTFGLGTVDPEELKKNKYMLIKIQKAPQK